MNWQSFTYPIRRKYQQIKRVIDFLPIIWNGFDFDYMYSIELFKKQLERQAELFESDKLNSDRSKQNASRIRTAIQLMEKVYNEDYSVEWIDIIEEKYGSDVLDWDSEDTGRGDGTHYIVRKYEKWKNSDEISKVESELFLESREKQKRAHKLLWDFIEHNIQYWWD
jgi:hypothetical protein